MSKLGERTGVLLNINLRRLTHECRSYRIRREGKGELNITLETSVLVANSLYLVSGLPVVPDHGIKIGQVLVRNLELTRRLLSEEEIFVVYDNLFDAWRAMRLLNPRYKAEEIPAVEAWRAEGDELTKITWTREVRMVDGQLEYSARAWRAIGPHKRVRNENKLRALKKSEEATRVKDIRGKINPGRLPLMYLTVDLALWARIQEASNIGERMDHRAMVLQLYIDAYTTAVSTTINDLEQLLRPEGVFGEERTPRKVRAAAARIRMSVVPLYELTARPFVHVFNHVAEDLSQAADLMDAAADHRDAIKMSAAKSFVHRAYRSLATLQKARLVQELLATVSRHYHSKVLPTNEQRDELLVFLNWIQSLIRGKDKFTREPLEKDFQNPILEKVDNLLDNAGLALENMNDRKDLAKARKALKAALAPF